MFGREKIEYKSPAQIRKMRVSGLLLASVLKQVRAAVKPGVTTKDLDNLAKSLIEDAGATSNFLGYNGFPGVLCTSVNEEVVHGIPGDRVLQDGDLVKIDGGCIVDGWHSDSAFTVAAGTPRPEDVDLMRATEDSMWDGIAALAGHGRLNDVGAAIENSINNRYGILEGLVGHGIGTQMHQAPEVLNYAVRERGPRIKPGLVVAIEPMMVHGEPDAVTLDDDWTIVTSSGKRGCHFEHTVAVTDGGVWVLTAEDGGKAELAKRGVEIAPLAD